MHDADEGGLAREVVRVGRTYYPYDKICLVREGPEGEAPTVYIWILGVPESPLTLKREGARAFIELYRKRYGFRSDAGPNRS